MDKETFFAHYPLRAKDSNKFDNGRILLIAGSEGIAGAAVLNISGAEAVGTSYIHCLLPADVYPIVATNKITTVYHPDSLASGRFLDDLSLYDKVDAIAIGSGLDHHPFRKQYLRCVLENFKGPIIADAQALKLLADDPALFKLSDKLILTPHLGEFSLLTGMDKQTIEEHKIEIAGNFAVTNQVDLVLKGSKTLCISKDGDLYINDSGNQALARAGSGDILTGMICGLCALYADYHTAVKDAVWLHGHLADEALGEHSIEVFDLLKYPEYADAFFYKR